MLTKITQLISDERISQAVCVQNQYSIALNSLTTTTVNHSHKGKQRDCNAVQVRKAKCNGAL